MTSPSSRGRPRAPRRLTTDQAIIAVLIGAMEANRHVSAEEAERAHHLIWFMRRFRRKSGGAVNRLIGTVRERMEAEGLSAVLDRAARAIPAKLGPPVFAAAVDLMLADATLEGKERRFVRRLAADLGVPPQLANDIVRVMLIKSGV